MPSFLCDNKGVEIALRKLVGLVTEAGGRVAPDTEILCQNGSLSIRSPSADSVGNELIFLPETALIPAKSVQFGLQGNKIHVESIDGDISALRKLSLDLIVEIYNLTEKISEFKNTSPLVCFGRDPDLQQHLLAGRSGLTKPPESDDPEYGQFIVNAFIKSRTLGYDFAGTLGKTPVLMPVIDFLNHHFMGAAFRPAAKGTEKGLSVGAQCPLQESTECFARYGLYDAFDAYMNYAYVEVNAPFLRSVACELDVVGLGKIAVDCRAGAKYDGPLSKDLQSLRVFMPRTIAEAPDRIRVSHLIVPWPARKFALRRVLGEIIRLFDDAQSNELLVRRVAEAERILLRRNLDYYRELERMLHERPRTRAYRAAAQLANIQQSRIRTYIDAVNKANRG